MNIKGHILTYEEIVTLHSLLDSVLKDETGKMYPVRVELYRSYLTFLVPYSQPLEMVFDLKKHDIPSAS